MTSPNSSSPMNSPRIHNGRFTIESPKGGHRTFQIKTAQRGNLKGSRIVSLLIGPDNMSNYKGFGFLQEDGIRVWNKYRGTDYDKLADVLWSLAAEGEQSRYYQIGYRLLVEARCVRCNRTLTTPESIRRGIGLECAVFYRGGRKVGSLAAPT